MILTRVLFIGFCLNCAWAWENLPQLPSNRRSQYYLLEKDGGYKYGFDTGTNYFAKQSGNSQNQVEGHFKYSLNGGKTVDVRYTSGVQGFVPTGMDGLQGQYATSSSYAPRYGGSGSSLSGDRSANNDNSYSFSYDTGSSLRQESADAQGNVRGRYAYTNKDGNHDLSYVAGSATGFLPTGGSLSVPNGLRGSGSSSPSGFGSGSYSTPSGGFIPSSGGSPDGSYSFSYNTGDTSREESADSQNNVKGRYSYSNSAGTHDLSYVAGAQTGFLATGGSLSIPNGLGDQGSDTPNSGADSGYYLSSFPTGGSGEAPNNDGSYSFSYNTGDSSREESADSQNNVRGRYSYTNSAGQHDLSYVAGAQTGFLPTGGSLATPNGLAGKTSSFGAGSAGGAGYSSPGGVSYQSGVPAVPSPSGASSVSNADGSYSFSYNTGDSSRSESADSQNNVRGSYSYTNKAGNHDLSYVAGAQTGFLPTGGSLATPNGLTGKSPRYGSGSQSYPSGSYGQNAPVAGVGGAPNADGSYSFSYNTGDSVREESADSQNNVRGRYSYTNSAGQHDLSYVAGSQTGFLTTGGSLATPNGLGGKSSKPSYGSGSGSGFTSPGGAYGGAGGSSGSATPNADGSYSFSYNTGDSSREESADSQNNVKGRYSYTNSAGHHDLSYVAGAQTGFLPTGGTLATPNGLNAKGSASGTGGAGGSGGAGGTLRGSGGLNNDGSYSFSYNTGDSSREESANSQNNVKGRYSYTNSAGFHDLSYVAGSQTGFLPTGGSLATPNGLGGKSFTGSSTQGYPTTSKLNNEYLPPIKTGSAKPNSYSAGNVLVQTYLPPSNGVKFGYIFDSKQ